MRRVDLILFVFQLRLFFSSYGSCHDVEKRHLRRTQIQHSPHHQFHHHHHNATLTGNITMVDVARGKLVVAFGDSLTHGYISFDQRIVHPYSLLLAELLNTPVLEHGKNGEKTSEMRDRFPEVMTALNISDVRVVIILGGTNDLSVRKGAFEIGHNIVALHRMAQSYARGENFYIYTIAMTIPESGWGFNETERLFANTIIRDYAGQCPGRVALVELEHSFTQSDPNNLQYWIRDKGHLSSLGYDGIARLIFESMTNFRIEPFDVSAQDHAYVC